MLHALIYSCLSDVRLERMDTQREREREREEQNIERTCMCLCGMLNSLSKESRQHLMMSVVPSLSYRHRFSLSILASRTYYTRTIQHY